MLKTIGKIPALAVSISAVILSACTKPAGPVDDPDNPDTPEQQEIQYLCPISENSNGIELTQTAENEYTVKTTGADPYLFFKPLSGANHQDSTVLTFEFKTTKGLEYLQIFFADPISEDRSVRTAKFSPTRDWQQWSENMYKSISVTGWGKEGDYLRMDFGDAVGVTFNIRNIYFRGMTDEEKAEADEWENTVVKKERMEKELKEYLDADFAAEVQSVSVSEEKVTVSGICPSASGYALAEVVPYQDITEIDKFQYTSVLDASEFNSSFDRFVSRDGFDYDRALSKWVVVKTGENDEIASHAVYADEFISSPSPAEVKLSSKKGLGGFVINEITSDIDDLGITSATVNITLTRNMLSASGAGAYQHIYGGKTYWFSRQYVDETDAALEFLQERNVVVAAIVLIDKPSVHADRTIGNLMKHPSYNPSLGAAHYTMPNMSTAESVNCYAAALDFFASRYCSSDAAHGRIHHWIMHNEVDYARDWTNMGENPVTVFTDTYMKSMRLCSNIVRQYDPNAEIFVSLTHSWTSKSADGYSSLGILDLIRKYSSAEGDFRWAVAYHCYPQDLLDPRTWEDEGAEFTRSTPYVTFKNLEVLSDWVESAENLYMGVRKRSVWLSENGTNSPSYSDSDLENQAAGFAYGWKKIKALDGIDAIQWHNWVDNRAEGGLRIGLRKYPDEEGDPYGRKPVWYLYQAAGTSSEPSAFDPYLSTIGIPDWNIIREITD